MNAQPTRGTPAHPDVAMSADAAATQLKSALGPGVLYLHGGWQALIDQLKAMPRAPSVGPERVARFFLNLAKRWEPDMQAHLVRALASAVGSHSATDARLRIVGEPEVAASLLTL